jgi:hypothetical protein
MIQTIGGAAGEIWRTLDSEGPLSISALASKVKCPRSTVDMGIGWLAREDKLLFIGTKRGVQLSLKK